MPTNLRHASGAVAAIAAMALLAGCSAPSTSEPQTEEQRPESDGSNLPFELSAGNSGSSGGSSGNEVVKYDDVNITDSNWDTLCMDDYVMSDDMEGTDYSSDYNSVSVSFTDDGKLDYVLVTPASGASLYYSSDLSEDPEPTASYDGSVVEVSGDGFLDYDMNNVTSFEIRLECDDSL